MDDQLDSRDFPYGRLSHDFRVMIREVACSAVLAMAYLLLALRHHDYTTCTCATNKKWSFIIYSAAVMIIEVAVIRSCERMHYHLECNKVSALQSDR